MFIARQGQIDQTCVDNSFAGFSTSLDYQDPSQTCLLTCCFETKVQTTVKVFHVHVALIGAGGDVGIGFVLYKRLTCSALLRQHRNI